MNPWFNTCELQTKARTLSTKTLGAHSPDWAQIIQMECGKSSFVKHFPSQWMLKEEHLASWTFQTTRDRSSFPPRLTFGIFEIWEDLWAEYISDIWKELKRRHEHLYQMLVSRVNGERGYCCMVSFMSANLWSWLQNCQNSYYNTNKETNCRNKIWLWDTWVQPWVSQTITAALTPNSAWIICYSKRCKR